MSAPEPTCGVTEHSIDDAARCHGSNYTDIYRAIRAEQLPARQRGRKWLLLCADVVEWVDRHSVPNAAYIERHSA